MACKQRVVRGVLAAIAAASVCTIRGKDEASMAVLACLSGDLVADGPHQREEFCC